MKIAAPDLEKAIAGSRLLVVTADDNEEELKEEVMDEISTLFDSLDPSGSHALLPFRDCVQVEVCACKHQRWDLSKRFSPSSTRQKFQ